MSSVAILAAHRHPRLRYVLRELSGDLGYKIRLFTDEDQWADYAADARIIYGTTANTIPALRLPSHPFLSGRHPTSDDLTVSWVDGLPLFFRVDEQADLLACIFFALSRYEEYQEFTPDAHDRFPATASHAQRNGYLHLPVVRAYAQQLANQLRHLFPELPLPKERPFRLQPTYDIDLLWAYRYRGWKGAASGLRDVATGKAARARDRFIPGEAPDPYFNLDYLLGLHPDVQPYIFWLLADNDCREDVNPYPIPQEQTEVMRSLADRAVHGIHPGYDSVGTEGKLKRETGRYQRVFQLRPQHSRQHFLRLRLPDTYRELRQNGVTNDHSMGYGDAAGWRAGTNLPFHWYDLHQETMTGLTVHPFAVMDVTLKNYLKLSPEEAVKTVTDLRGHTKAYGGNFTLLWHNSSFAEAHGWAGWREVYERLLQIK